MAGSDEDVVPRLTKWQVSMLVILTGAIASAVALWSKIEYTISSMDGRMHRLEKLMESSLDNQVKMILLSKESEQSQIEVRQLKAELSELKTRLAKLEKP